VIFQSRSVAAPRRAASPRRASSRWRPVTPGDLNQLIEQAVSLTRTRWQTEAGSHGRTIAFHTQLGVVPRIAGDAGELRDLLTNLIFNAVDALPQGGAITIHTSSLGETVSLRISDTGTDMTEEVRLRCLEPFFTTKGEGSTGLGLSMVFGIVQRPLGTIEIESQVGEGTDFILRLPALAVEIVTPPDELLPSNSQLRVLVVDDQPLLASSSASICATTAIPS
jgi:signal transduction histidine kinase